MGGPKVSCPAAAMDYHCSTRGETWAQAGAKHRAASAQGLSCSALWAKPNLCQVQALPGSLRAELPPQAAGRAGSCHGTSLILSPGHRELAARPSNRHCTFPYPQPHGFLLTAIIPSSKQQQINPLLNPQNLIILVLLMRFPGFSHCPGKCQISCLTWKSSTQLPLHHLALPPVLFSQQHFSMYATKRREGAEGVEGKASSRAKCWWEGEKQLEEVALSLGSSNYFILHAKRHTPGIPNSPHPANPQTMEGISQRSRSKETKLFFSWALEDWITQHSPRAGQNYQSKKMLWVEEQSRAEASLLRGEGPAGQREGLADTPVLLRENLCPSVTYKAVDEDLIVHVKPSQFSNVTYASSHLPAEATLSLVPWKCGWGWEI